MRALFVVAFLLGTSACQCKPAVEKIAPSLNVSPAGLDFGQVKVDGSKQAALRLESQTRTAVVISSLTLEGESASAFRVETFPEHIDSLSSVSINIIFSPKALALNTASLVIRSDDPTHGLIRVALAGEGVEPQIEVTLDCLPSRGCHDEVRVEPLTIDFGSNPLVTGTPVDPTTLPRVNVVNSGPVALHVIQIEFRGSDASAFSIAGNLALPPEGMLLDASTGFNFPVRFVPLSEQQSSYSALLNITSDDPAQPSITIELKGTLKPNLPPLVCANLIRVVPALTFETPREYGSTAQWASLLVPPVDGYDFTQTRDVRPNELVVFSAHADAADAAVCSTDPEDSRTGLTYQWTLHSVPEGSPFVAVSGANTAQAQLRPIATGEYVMELTVTDSGMSSVSARLRFVVAVKQDLVVQLQWAGFSGIDLDLHLIRPSVSSSPDPFEGAFDFFSAGLGKTSGDLNGYSWRARQNNTASGFDFDWGEAGSADDPVLNLDDRGDGALIENVSLNFPEHDPECTSASCTYRVMVHYFNDARTPANALACTVGGSPECGDGSLCDCAPEYRCVAQAADVGVPPQGSGKCYLAPKPVVRIFVRGSPVALAVIPLENDEVHLGAPCQLWHVADIDWPSVRTLLDGGTPVPVVNVVGADSQGKVTHLSVARFGRRQAGGSLQCSPDSNRGALDWYSRQP